MWPHFIAPFAARINGVAIFWNERKDTVEKTFPAAPNPTVDGESVRNENSLDTFFSIPDYITTLAGVRRAEYGGAKTRFAAEYPDPRFDVLIVSCSPFLARGSAR